MTLVEEVEAVSALGLPLPISSRVVTISVFIYYTEKLVSMSDTWLFK